jgi:hypothetical protein
MPVLAGNITMVTVITKVTNVPMFALVIFISRFT